MVAEHPTLARARRRRSITRAKVFGFSFLIGLALMLVFAFLNREPSTDLKPLGKNAFVTGQLQVRQIRSLVGTVATIIDLRPDGEAPDQPSSKTMEDFCRGYGLHFAYVPVPHGNIPDSAVRALEAAIEANPSPILLYCRSGHRAVRTYCLSEASTPGGLNLGSILALARAAGQPADDLTADLKTRILHRAPTGGKAH